MLFLKSVIGYIYNSCKTKFGRLIQRDHKVEFLKYIFKAIVSLHIIKMMYENMKKLFSKSKI